MPVLVFSGAYVKNLRDPIDYACKFWGNIESEKAVVRICLMAVSMKNVDAAFHGVGQKAYLSLPSTLVCYFFHKYDSGCAECYRSQGYAIPGGYLTKIAQLRNLP